MTNSLISLYLLKTVLISEKGVGKTYALEACLWYLCGLNDDSKLDPSIHDNTVKGIAGLTTNPIPVDDGESTTKVSV